ncbi:PopZ family protein [Prosthecomicrobium pneumaticum]|uniref:Pole-organizing protein PopZ n=1 Tax=Prosthecomicrobium pneumaticum TaxID=81895 RepID=A0A7W9FPM4_9HYPH|nr:DUF2497 domain-containing protein [Prosthecomicrobium pneumaticum]MBB5754557.1 hypothetical protein [Prosthecomicrobium pneumaticum]
MEEILASIRRIISDEETVAVPQASARAVRPVLVEEAEPAPAEVAAPFESAGALRPGALAPFESLAQAAGAAAATVSPLGSPDREEEMAARRSEDELSSGFGRSSDPAPASPPGASDLDAAARAPETPPADEMRLGPLLSDDANAAVNAAFDDLAGALLASRPRTVEDLVKDMLRPMLKGWLDKNLPPLVERLVREEIERVSRGR